MRTPLICLALCVPWFAHAGEPLSLDEAERRALRNDALVRQADELAEAGRHSAVRARQLSDPQIRLTALNLPTDTFNLDQEPLTQTVVAISQALPRGDSLDLAGRQAERAADEAQRSGEAQALRVKKQIRSLWAQIYVAQARTSLLEQRRTLLEDMLPVATASYRVGRAGQDDVLQVRLQLARLKDRLVQVEGEEARLRAELGRWLPDAAERAWPQQLPPRLTRWQENEAQAHPELATLRARADQQRLSVDLARQAYKPALTLQAAYGMRDSRQDVVTFGVQFDLPIFTEKRQDQRLAERQRRYQASLLDLEDRRATLNAGLQARIAQALSKQRRLAGYEEEILPELVRITELNQSDYESGRAGFDRFLQSSLAVIDARLEHLDVLAALALDVIDIHYLQGEDA